MKCEYTDKEHSIIADDEIDARDSFLNKTVLKWLNIEGARPSSLVIAIPIDSIENWVVCALDGSNVEGKHVEKYVDIFHGFIMKSSTYHGLNTTRSELATKQNIAAKFKGDVCRKWGCISRECKQARKFEDQLFAITLC